MLCGLVVARCMIRRGDKTQSTGGTASGDETDDSNFSAPSPYSQDNSELESGIRSSWGSGAPRGGGSPSRAQGDADDHKSPSALKAKSFSDHLTKLIIALCTLLLVLAVVDVTLRYLSSPNPHADTFGGKIREMEGLAFGDLEGLEAGALNTYHDTLRRAAQILRGHEEGLEGLVEGHRAVVSKVQGHEVDAVGLARKAKELVEGAGGGRLPPPVPPPVPGFYLWANLTKKYGPPGQPTEQPTPPPSRGTPPGRSTNNSKEVGDHYDEFLSQIAKISANVPPPARTSTVKKSTKQTVK